MASLTVLWRRYTRRSSRSCILHIVNEEFRIRCGFVVLGRKSSLESACPALCRQEGVAPAGRQRPGDGLGAAAGELLLGASGEGRPDRSGCGVAGERDPCDGVGREFSRSQGRKTHSPETPGLQCVTQASACGERGAVGSGVWRGLPGQAEGGPGRGRGSLQLQRPCPSVPLGTKPIPGFLQKGPSAKDLVSLPLLLSCGLS